ncbi:MAG: GAP family protein [Acidimicrobiia bacterium]|jgi:hypothetical protein
MGELMARVVPLGLGAAVSPTVLTVSVLLMCSPRRPVARGALFALGVLSVLAVISVLGITVLDRFADHHPSATERAVSDSVDLVLGLVLLALAARTALRPRDPTTERTARHPADHDGLARAYALGLVMMATNVTTIVLYIPAMRDIGRADVSTSDQAVALLVMLGFASLPATVPLLLRVVVPGPAQRALTRLDGAMTRHRRAIVLAVEIVFGVYLIVRGL